MTNEVAVLAGGCFWGVEELLRKIPGVIDTEVGYAGGDGEQATYQYVKTGRTDHAEAVQIEFDPAILSRDQLLDLFFRLHDPTTRNRQGNDMGPQYRSTIFVSNEAERESAERAIGRAAAAWAPRSISTTIETGQPFYSAETYHQDYLQKNPGGYTCHYWRGPEPT